ncbi:hypothetical protein [Burkholderia savannae]|uniref:hypothetical protein n=1 Tax=Burkholderia savannae TaxID=1637837 RepID=UPI000AADF387|nr:hypothetical protein [Burkholderia savannae]
MQIIVTNISTGCQVRILVIVTNHFDEHDPSLSETVWRNGARGSSTRSITSFVRFSRRYVPERTEQPSMISSVYPFTRRKFDVQHIVP